MKDLFEILTSLVTPLMRGTTLVLSGRAGKEACLIAWVVLALQALRTVEHAGGIISGLLLFSALTLTVAVTVLTAFMTAGGNEYEPNSKKAKSEVLVAMLFNGVLAGTVVSAVLVGVLALFGSISAPLSLILMTAVYSAAHSWLVSYLLRRKAAL